MISNYKRQLINLAIAEDIGNGDHTSLACIPADATGKAELRIKQKGIIAGIEVASTIFRQLIPNLKLDIKIGDGNIIEPGDIAFTIQGNTQKILQAERLALNFMQRMSGIATITHQYASQIADLPTQILDTRKTTPGMRIFEKEAVKIGGGQNHRMGLYDMMMIKDNHIDYAGGITKAIEQAVIYQQNAGLYIPIEVEARNIEEVKAILNTGKANRIMLDNFNYASTREAVKIINKQCETESSGGINLESVRKYAECGVDYISAGALTHQINSLDMSLKAV